MEEAWQTLAEGIVQKLAVRKKPFNASLNRTLALGEDQVHHVRIFLVSLLISVNFIPYNPVNCVEVGCL